MLLFMFGNTVSFAQTPDINGIVYVTPGGSGDGSSWINATGNLQGAINASSVTKVFVAIGNYSLSSSIILKNNVAIYGGFDPGNGISDLDDARILPSLSVEGSALDGQNAIKVIDNTYTAGSPLTNTAIFDGFTVKNGYTLGGSGAGIYNYYASPILRNLVIKNNETGVGGGGIYNSTFSAAIISNSIIYNNTAEYGGGVRNNKSDAVLTNVIIKNNIAKMSAAGSGGGGIFNENSNIILTNVIITDNSTNFQGGGIRNLSGNPIFTNVSLVNNTAVNSATTTAMNIAGGLPVINNSVVFGTSVGNYTPQFSLIEGNTDFTNGNLDASGITDADIFTNPSAGDYTLKNSSAALNAGNNSLNSTTTDLAGNPRVYNSGTIDLGAYEYQGDPLVLPLTLISFTAKADGNQAKLQWQTANEFNNKGFEIYRSGDEGSFVKIGSVVSLQSSHAYSFTDYSPLNGNNYYKLVQIDQDGSTTELGVKKLNFQLSASYIQLYPNPTTDYLSISFGAGTFTQLQVIDLQGKVLQQYQLNAQENNKHLSLGNYPAGIYIIKLHGNAITESRKVVRR